MGGKKLGFWVMAFSIRATGESAWLFMAKPFKKLTDRYGSITMPDYLARRFQIKTHKLRKLAALALTVFVTVYVSAQMDATGSVFEAFLGWNYYLGAVVGFLLGLAYIFMGGFFDDRAGVYGFPSTVRTIYGH